MVQAREAKICTTAPKIRSRLHPADNDSILATYRGTLNFHYKFVLSYDKFDAILEVFANRAALNGRTQT